MSKYLYILDPGHGGMVNGVNKSKDGKYSPKFEDGTRFYEGVNNRDNVARIMAKLKARNIDCVDIVAGSQEDVPLKTRVKNANLLHRQRKCVYISIHSDAAGNGEVWMNAKGISVHTSAGETQSDKFAELVIKHLQINFKDTVKWRQDTTDGDKDIENPFYVLTQTHCPAIVIEAGFHDNKEEVLRMKTEEWKNNLVNAVVSACVSWENQ